MPYAQLMLQLNDEGHPTLARSPDGNGGVFSSLAESGMLDDMVARGIVGCHVYGVDNVLVKPGRTHACRTPLWSCVALAKGVLLMQNECRCR